MKRTIIIIFALIFLFPYAAATEANPNYNSSQLIEQAKLLDGNMLQYKGEVIGDVLARGEFAWLSVSDGANAISVFLPANLMTKPLILGRYAVRGDVLTITGVFHRACSEHGGDMDIHAETMMLNEVGFSIPVQTSARFMALTGMLSISAASGLMYVKKIHAMIP